MGAEPWTTREAIPPAIRDSPKAREAFKEILRSLYEQYEAVVDSKGSMPSIAAMHRNSSLIEWRSPATMTYYACDTGVPNELILSAYALIFL